MVIKWEKALLWNLGERERDHGMGIRRRVLEPIAVQGP